MDECRGLIEMIEGLAEDEGLGPAPANRQGSFPQGIEKAQFFANGKSGELPSMGRLAVENALKIEVHSGSLRN
jgi:hypothetical protein